jgi:hypothetical protein
VPKSCPSRAHSGALQRIPGVWAGESKGGTCDACDQPILTGEIEYEANIAAQVQFVLAPLASPAHGKLMPGAGMSPPAAVWPFSVYVVPITMFRKFPDAMPMSAARRMRE